MSDLVEFRKEVNNLKVMVPGRDATNFKCILQGHENFKSWKCSFEDVIFSTNGPLIDYYFSELHTITDNDLLPVNDDALSRNVRRKYNWVLYGMLRASTSDAIRKSIERSYSRLAKTDENCAKAIISQLDERYGKLTFRANFKLVSGYLNNFKSKDTEAVALYYEGMLLALETPTLFNAGLLLASGSAYTQKQMLRKYGDLTTFNKYDFSLAFDQYQTESPKPYQRRYKKKGRMSKLPPSACPICEGNHWKADCPGTLGNDNMW